jgi:uncharacterized protein YqgV (UPF0045/DUF77 family)
MHSYIVNASLQLLPVGGTKHPYEWVDDAIVIIKKSNLKTEVGAFTTTVEGSYSDVIQLINDINEYLIEAKCREWILGVQLQLRSEADITAEEKTAKHR